MDVQPGQIYMDLGPIPLGRVDEFGVDWAIDAEGFDGWGATASTRRSVQKVRGHGGWSGLGFAQPRQLSIMGRAYAPTPEAAAAALDRLNDAASIEDTILTVYEPGKTRYLYVHRTDEVIPKWQTPKTLVWAIGLEADDHRKLHAELSGGTLLPFSTGGLTVPYTPPYTLTSTQVSGQVSLTNPGNEVGPVRVRIDGPCSGPVITHVDTDQSLVFASSLVLGVGEWLDIDMDAHTVYANGQANRRMYVTEDNWSGFTPGVNTWAFTAAAYNAGSQMTVYASPADK